MSRKTLEIFFPNLSTPYTWSSYPKSLLLPIAHLSHTLLQHLLYPPQSMYLWFNLVNMWLILTSLTSSKSPVPPLSRLYRAKDCLSSQTITNNSPLPVFQDSFLKNGEKLKTSAICFFYPVSLITYMVFHFKIS